MDAYGFLNNTSLLPDEHPCALQTADSLFLTPLDAVFAEYDCLRSSTDGNSPWASSSSNHFEQQDLTFEAPFERSHVTLEAIRKRKVEHTPETSVPLVSSSATSSDSGGDEDYVLPQSRGSAAKSRPRGVQKARARRTQRQSNHKAGAAPSEQCSKPDAPSISGLLQPFDAVKNYGMAGTLSLQQLNARIKSCCNMD